MLRSILFLATIFASEITAAGHNIAIPNQNPNLDIKQEPIQILRLDPNLDPDKASLGKKLFHDKRLSRGNVMACDSCHFIDLNGANNRAFSKDRDDKDLDINTLTVFNSGYNHRLFWDGRAKSLEEQINHVVKAANEFDTDWGTIVNKLKKIADYRVLFKSTYSDGISANNIRNAIATYERSLVTINSPFDCYLKGHKNAISEEEKNGYQLFKSYGCIACHQGANVGGNLFIKLGVFGDYFADRGNVQSADLGRYNFTKNERDKYVFRVPSLRLAALTPPYFHDASAQTLEEATILMAKYQLGRLIPIIDIDHIVAFLRTLPGNMPNAPNVSDCKMINKQKIKR
jgi:cytochrome c peroxidase